ncbi:protein sym [Salix suchowensis]|nr:protein sym [Salix suchowensis]
MMRNPVCFTRKASLLYRFVGFSPKPTSHTQITGFRACSSSTLFSNSLSYSHGDAIGFDQFRVLAVSGGVSGGSGGLGGFLVVVEVKVGASGGAGSGGIENGHSFHGNNEFRALLTSICYCRYLNLLAKYPVLTKAVTSAILTLMGDLICQFVIDQAPSLDLKRTFVFTFLGLVLVGPTLHFWYLYLSKLVTLPGASGAFLRLLVDQFVFSPIFIGVFLSTLVTLEGRPSEVIPKLQQEWFSAVLANWQLWVPFQFLNFRFVPQQFQVLAANVIALVWNVILSFKAHKEVIPK